MRDESKGGAASNWRSLSRLIATQQGRVTHESATCRPEKEAEARGGTWGCVHRLIAAENSVETKKRENCVGQEGRKKSSVRRLQMSVGLVPLHGTEPEECGNRKSARNPRVYLQVRKEEFCCASVCVCVAESLLCVSRRPLEAV